MIRKRIKKSATSDNREQKRTTRQRQRPVSQVRRPEKAPGYRSRQRDLILNLTETLREREKFWRALTENSTDAIALMDSAGKVLYQIPSAGRALGYKTGEVVGKDIFDLVHPDDLDAGNDFLARSIQKPGSSVTARFRFLRADGAWAWLECTLTNLLSEPSVRAIVVNYRDITARKQTEDALAAEKERLAITLGSIGDGVITTDVAQRITLFNVTAEQLTGWSQREALGKHLFEVFRIINLKTRQTAENPVPKVLASGAIVGLEADTALIAKDGTERVVSSSIASIKDGLGQPTGVVLVFRDITRLRNAEDELRESQEYARNLIESSMDMIIAVDRDRKITTFNKAAQETFGYEPEQVLGKNISMLYAHPEHGDGIQRVVHESGRYVQEVLNKRKNGQVFPCLISASLLKDTHGETVGVMGVSRDITKLKQAEAQNIKAERLAALGRMAAALAHEINNPLQAIRGTLDLALDFPLDQDERENNLRIVRQEIERLSLVTGRIMQFARPTNVPRRLISLTDLLQQTLTLAGKQLQHAHFQVVTDFQPLPALPAGPEQLMQIFLNLVLNAIEAAGDGGRLEIATCTEEDYALVTFANSGPVLTPEEKQQIFEPFFTTKQNGTGLGLSVSQDIVQQHGGTITVENLSEARGVIFTIRLPLAS